MLLEWRYRINTYYYYSMIPCSGHDGTVRIWSLPSRTHHFLRQTCVFNYGDHLREERHEQQLGLVRWNGNGKLLAGAINNMINIWLVAGMSHV